MDIKSWFAPETWRLTLPEWILIVVSFATVMWITTTPWATTGAGVAFLLAPSLLLIGQGHRVRAPPIQPVIIVAAFCWIYIFIASFWSADLLWAGKALLIGAGAICALLLTSALAAAIPPCWLSHLMRAALVSFAIAAVFAAIEETTDHQIKKALFWPFRALEVRDGAITFNMDYVVTIRPHRTNWNMVNLSLLLWPMLVVARAQLGRCDYKILFLLLSTAILLAIFQSEHETSMIAVICGFVVFLIASFSLRSAIAIVVVGWVSAISLAVPVSQQMFASELHHKTELSSTFRSRIVIWKYTSDQVLLRPIFGVGTGSTQPLDEARGPDLPLLPLSKGIDTALRTGSHPHNFYIQVWYEFGAIGAVLFLLLGLMIVRGISQLSGELAPNFLSAFATVAVTCISSFGLFEHWYISAIVITACMLTLAARLDQRESLNN